MSTLFIAGATGLIGQHALQLAIRDPQIKSIIAPTRRRLAAHPKLENRLVDFEALEDLPIDFWQADAAICTLGTTRKKAGSAKRFREIDFDIPAKIATELRKTNCKHFLLVSSLGANPASKNLYQRVKGELEETVIQLGFPSITILRPSLLGGNRDESRPSEYFAKTIFKLLNPLVPKKYRLIEPELIAHSLIERAKQTCPRLEIIESDRIHTFSTE